MSKLFEKLSLKSLKPIIESKNIIPDHYCLHNNELNRENK